MTNAQPRKRPAGRVHLESNEDGVYRLVVRDADGRLITGRKAKRILEATRARLRAEGEEEP
jgi:hypothetical protein